MRSTIRRCVLASAIVFASSFNCETSLRTGMSNTKLLATFDISGRERAAKISTIFGVAPQRRKAGRGNISCRKFEASSLSLSTDGAGEDADAGTKSAEEAPLKSNRSGLRNAILMGPPLVLKFCVVLVVKFVTDVVWFPLLYLGRILRLVKNRTLGLLFPKNDADKVEGGDDQPKLTHEEDLEATRKVIMGDNWGLRRDRFRRDLNHRLRIITKKREE